MARRRFQRGSVFLRGTRNPVWVGRWREDRIIEGDKVRVPRKETLGTRKEYPTKRLALRELEARLAPINNPSYRALHHATFKEFAGIWTTNALTQHKQSTQSAVHSSLKVWLLPHFGSLPMSEITGKNVQDFIQGCKRSPKTCRNHLLIFKMIWKAAKGWGYAVSNPFEGIVLPKLNQKVPMFFSVDEVSRILAAAREPFRTFYWIAAETGLRAGELCGLRIGDLDLDKFTIEIKQSVWNGRVQTPKSKCSLRQFAIGPRLAAHLKEFLRTWRPNPQNLLFATKTGNTWYPCNVLRENLHPILSKLEIQRCGLHAFRHTNGSLMDRVNAPMKVRQERLGHAPGSEVTMRVYTHAVSEDDRRVAAQIGELLRPNAPDFPEQFPLEPPHGQRLQ